MVIKYEVLLIIMSVVQVYGFTNNPRLVFFSQFRIFSTAGIPPGGQEQV